MKLTCSAQRTRLLSQRHCLFFALFLLPLQHFPGSLGASIGGKGYVNCEWAKSVHVEAAAGNKDGLSCTVRQEERVVSYGELVRLSRRKATYIDSQSTRGYQWVVHTQRVILMVPELSR